MNDELATTEDPITVRNALSYKDMLFCMSMPKHPAFRCLQFVLIVNSVFLACTGIAALIMGSPQVFLDPRFWKMMLTCIAGCTLLFPSLALLSYLLLRKKLEAEITLTKKMIKVRTSAGTESDLEWKTVSLVSKRHGAIVLRISQNPDMYYWIPMKRFASAEAAETFFARAKEYWENLRHSVSFEAPTEPILAENSRSIVGNLTLKELVTFDYYLLARVVFIPFLIVAAAALLLSNWLWNVALLLGGFLIGLLIGPYFGARAKFKKHPEWMEARTTISPDFFESKTAVGGIDSRIVWTSVKSIWTWNKALLYKLDSGRTVVIPFRCFPSQQEADEFGKLSMEYWQSSKAKHLALKEQKSLEGRAEN